MSDDGRKGAPGTEEGQGPAAGSEASAETGPKGRTLPVVSGMDRREALKLLALAAAAPAALSGCGPDGEGGAASGAASGAGEAPSSGAAASNPLARGDAWDPDLVNPQLRWEKILTEDEREGLAALCDVIIPADDVSPAASAVGAHDFIDEWVSAPYDFARNDLVLVRGGLGWLDGEAARRFGAGRRFRDLDEGQKKAICDDICYLPEAREEHRMPARFFTKVRDLTATAFYTTPEGMEDIGYVGNMASSSWGPPPPEVLRHLGLE